MRLNSINNSSLVVDRPWNPPGAQNVALAYACFDFYARNEQMAAGLLGLELKQVSAH